MSSLTTSGLNASNFVLPGQLSPDLVSVLRNENVGNLQQLFFNDGSDYPGSQLFIPAEVLGTTATAGPDEGAVLPVPGSTTNVLGTFTWKKSVDRCSVTDDLQRAVAGSGQDSNYLMGRQVANALKNINKLVESQIITELLVQIGNTGTWGTQSKSTYANLQSVQTVSTGSLTLEDMYTTIAGLNAVGASPNMILMSANNSAVLDKLMVNPLGVSGNPLFVNGSGAPIDLGFTVGSWKGMTVVMHPQMGDADCLFLNSNDVQIYEHEGVKIRLHQDQDILQDLADISYQFTVVAKKPHECGRISSIS